MFCSTTLRAGVRKPCRNEGGGKKNKGDAGYLLTEKFPVVFGRTEWKINEDQHLAGGFMETSVSYKKKIIIIRRSL